MIPKTDKFLSLIKRLSEGRVPRINNGCGKKLYENEDGDVNCGSYMSGGIMLCPNCSSKTGGTK